ncbi:hypothetical protein, partial [Anaerotruncus massiliensis (ex Liu et al. 2021)]|uniref:hypothetical protein n=1 Tax=Anaerotruncus massiliensis (ex Liu et al. 2021) TaxID=2321404 RepID=UPI003AB746CD
NCTWMRNEAGSIGFPAGSLIFVHTLPVISVEFGFFNRTPAFAIGNNQNIAFGNHTPVTKQYFI